MSRLRQCEPHKKANTDYGRVERIPCNILRDAMQRLPTGLYDQIEDAYLIAMLFSAVDVVDLPQKNRGYGIETRTRSANP